MKTGLLIPILVLLISLPLGAQQSNANSFSNALVKAAMNRTKHRVVYDGAYLSIPYPGGDVPANIGVCTDVVIRSYRALGHDLQELVHKDMKANFNLYPKTWGLKRTDTNIDHRRVPNLQKFFERHGTVFTKSKDASEYKPGDLVTWMVGRNLPHIGIVVNQRSGDSKRPLVVHNIGAGPMMEDVLFEYPITGHYRFTPK